jgi:hypothetical protein
MTINVTHKYYIKGEYNKHALDNVLSINIEYNCEMHLIHENDRYYIEIYFNEFEDLYKFVIGACEEDYKIYSTLSENPDYDPDHLKKRALDEAIGNAL